MILIKWQRKRRMDLRVFIESIVNKGGELISISSRFIDTNHYRRREKNET